MNRTLLKLVHLIALTSLLVASCDTLREKRIVVNIVYGSEKQEWLTPLVETYNQGKHKTSNDSVIFIEATPMGSIESFEAILRGQIQPTVWSPASDIYIPVANSEWQKGHSTYLVDPASKNLVLSPVVIAIWRPMAEALGWPGTQLGWEDLSRLAASEQGWAAYGYPEWGSFKFGHTHPNFSNSGLVAMIAQSYAAAGKRRGLNLADLKDEKTKTFIRDVQSSIIHYGTSTGFFAERMFARGPSYLSAAVMYENLIVAQESKRIAGTSSQLPVVAVYPKEGTFWSNHPYGILNAPWVTSEHREAALDFQSFLLDKPQQIKAIELGFRPADPSIPLASPLDSAHGVDTNQPQTVLEVPAAEVIVGVQELWREVKKPVDIVLVIDTSGSMKGDKISSARNSLIQFINLLDDRDRLEILSFNTDSIKITPLSPLGEKREDTLRRVSGIVEGGGTALYDATAQAYRDLGENGNPRHIRAVVVLSDGMDNESGQTLDQLMAQIQGSVEDGGNSIKLFTIAFGDNADQDILRQMAEVTGGRVYISDPSTIAKIYAEIATFF